jgi:membrane associated rhomboid family serine protease
MNRNSLGSEIKNQFQNGTMTNRLLLLNLFVFLFLRIYSILINLFEANDSIISEVQFNIFILETKLSWFLMKPWGLFTNIFAHYDIWHFIQNMLFLYFVGKLFEQVFGSKSLFWLYFLGGVMGGVFEIISHSFLPAFQSSNSSVLGASGSVMAILSALAFYNPNMKIQLYGAFQIKIIFIALFFWLMDIIKLSNGFDDKIAHFAHLGGVFFGYLAIRNINSKSNILNRADNFWQKIKNFFKPKNIKSKSRTNTFKKDEDYAFEKNKNQKRIDLILDKISKSGYESLSKDEKDFLFKQSKKL